jgi:hypothetical protein
VQKGLSQLKNGQVGLRFQSLKTGTNHASLGEVKWMELGRAVCMAKCGLGGRERGGG